MVALMAERSNANWCELAVKTRSLTLAGFETRIFFVYYIDPATTTNNPVGAVTALQGLE